MCLNKGNILTANLFIFFTVGLCIFIGKFITVLPAIVPVILVLGFFMFFLAIAKTDLAMNILIFAMLLSPEMTFGAITHQRQVAIRIEDLLIVVFLFAWLVQTTIHRQKSIIKRTPINKFIGLYVAIFSLSTVMGMTSVRLKPITGIFYILKYIEYLVIYYLVSGILKTKLQMKVYLKAFIMTFAIVTIYGLTQIGSGRVSAPFEGKVGEPNTLGGYIILILGIIIGLVTHVRSLKWRLPLIGLAGVSLIPFAFTLSRSSYMAIIPMYMTLIIFNKSQTRNMLIGILLIGGLLSVFFFPQSIKDRIKYTFVGQKQETIVPVKIGGVTLGPSASARIHDWIRLFNKWKYRPYLGYGITGAGFVDSQYIRTLVELGIIGMVAFLALLVSIFKQTLKIYYTTKDDWYKGLALGFLAGHVGLIFHAVTANTFILIRIMEPYWFLAAMVMMIPQLEKIEEERQQTIQKEGFNPREEIDTPQRKGLPRNTELLYGS